MKLSEAIRLGAMLKPQAHGNLWSDGGSCAMGAAYEAAGVSCPQRLNPGERVDMTIAATVFPLLNDATVTCPTCGYHQNDQPLLPFGVIVTHLNDSHGWTREQIADWVESIEKAQAELPQPVSREEVSA